LQASCKECNRTPEVRAQQREAAHRYIRSEKGRVKNREKAHRNFHDNPKTREYLITYQKKRRKSDPEYAERSRAYHREHTKRWRKENPEKVKESDKKQYRKIANTPELRAKYTKYQRDSRQARQKSDPEFHQHLMSLAKRGQHKRRAIMAETDGTYTQSEWDRLCEYYNHSCVKCSASGPLTVDHVIPVTKQGRNVINNLQPLCRSCNSQKHTKIADYRPSLPDWFGEDI
jgi:5-methylcytosine-specific restriction endonuclease McrA